jgi:21S rRNA (GM2251-2'-O)-methyltransferase
VRHQESEERYPSKRDDGGHRRSQEERYSTKAEDRERPATREHRASTATGIKPFVPESLPYTTAASEFLYGYSVVVAALKGGRRKLYNLYVHTRGANHEGVTTILARARSAGVKIREVGDEYSRVLDKASSGRPHNVRC